MRLESAMYQLRNHTLPFLQTHLLSLSGAGQSGTRVNYLCYYDAALGGNQGFSISTLPRATTYMPTDGKVSTAVQVHNVRMIPNHEDLDVSHIEPYILDGAGPDLMMTGQLSACVFAIRQEAGRLIVGHIQPGGKRQTGTMLKQTVKLMGRFQNHGRVTHVFGLGDYTTRAHVIGLRQGGTWRIYGQQVASGSGPVHGAVQIV